MLNRPVIVAACTLFTLNALAQSDGTLQTAVVTEPALEPQAPACGVGETYALAQTGAGAYQVNDHTDGVVTAIGSLLLTSEVQVAADLPAAVNDAEGTCAWYIGRGFFTPAGSSAAVEVGVVRSEAMLLPPQGGCLYLNIATFIPVEIAQANMTAVSSSVGVDVVPDEGEPTEGGGQTGSALGSSCSCPACPLGGRIWIPFFVIGIGRVPGGTSCCSSACNAACENLHRTGDPAEAWLAGQGVWVTCMLCQ
jgi:hypothetical protein